MLCLSIPSVLVRALALLAVHVTCDGSLVPRNRAVLDDPLGASLLGWRHAAMRVPVLGTDSNTPSAAVMDIVPTDVPSDQLGLAAAEEQSGEMAQVNLDLYGFDARLWRASAARGGPTKHPFWKPEWGHLWRLEVIVCSIALFLSGILCSAGGIGGGGIYVTVLMVFGQLSVVDAVPLSKAVVFFGSISSLVLNMRKNFVSSSSTRTLIDYNLCRLVVPSALLGTYAGVFLNWLLPGWIIVLLLTLILCIMTATVALAAMRQHAEEHNISSHVPASSEIAAAKAGDAQAQPEMQTPPAETALVAPGGSASGTLDSGNACELPPVCSKLRSRLTSQDVLLAFGTEFIVICCSVLHFHAESCRRALGTEGEEAACNHPVIGFLGRGTMRNWMENHTSASVMHNLTMLIPATVCTLVLWGYTLVLVKNEGWHVGEAMCYHGMAIVTGALAGLVGIGGGLIFAPFFLGMGVEPSVAVATSSTCVIFTSSSTTLQYLLTDRIIMSLTLMYGTVNLLASYSGTSLVHYLQDTLHTRRSLISLIVGAGVLISAVLSLSKLISVVTG